jgi:phage shock protein A
MRMIPERCHPRSSSSSSNSNNNKNMMSRMRMRLLLLLVAVAATVASTSTAGGSTLRDEVLEAATDSAAHLRRATSGKPLPADSKTTTDTLLQSIMEEVRGLQVRVKSLEDENGRLRGGSSNSARRALAAAAAGTTPVSLAQFNLYKKTVATQFATLNQSLQSTSAPVDAFKVDFNGKLGKVQADLQKALDSMLALTNKTEKTDQKTVELDSALSIVSGRVGTLETTTENFTTGLDQLTARVAEGADRLSGAVARLDATTQDVGDLAGRLACVDASSTATDLVFSGCNVHLRNGAGQTTTTNGFGNLIVGYNEEAGVNVDRRGSHMVVVGPLHSWTGYGGLVSGIGHHQEAAFASVIGGTEVQETAVGTTKRDRPVHPSSFIMFSPF